VTARLETPQGDLFGGAQARLEPSLVREAPVTDAVLETARRLPRTVRLGTSSWAFPGWAGVVYDRQATPSALSRRGLDPYSRHPLLRCVGVDRTYYSPLPASQFEEYAALVPADFRFVVKADRALTFPSFSRTDPGSVGRTYHENPDFLNARRATDTVVGPVAAGLGSKLGVILFQFPPLPARAVGGTTRFARDLTRFLKELPQGLPYAVELRGRELLVPEVLEAINQSGAALVRAVHPSLPTFADQQALSPAATSPVVIRWMLGHQQRYEEAKERYAPFDRLVDPDPTTRAAIAEACLDASLKGA
jgi:uncharacterized protein YecE (DUF72 family)